MALEPDLSCPFCPFTDGSLEILQMHLDALHESQLDISSESTHRQFSTDQTLDRTHDGLQDYFLCPDKDCGEYVPFSDLQSHLDLHAAESLAFEELGTSSDGKSTVKTDSDGQAPHGDPSPSRRLEEPQNRNRYRVEPQFWKPLKAAVRKFSVSVEGRSGASDGRLGKAELGPYANEKKMPAWLKEKLQTGAKVTTVNQLRPDGTLARVELVSNETRDLIPIIAQLCEKDDTVQKAYVCHPGAQHVSKLPREGGFCGYRNIQMMISFIQSAKWQGHEYFPDRIPSILQIQEMIETAWDQGINHTGRIETGGIIGTRKYIGTSEAQALLISLKIQCDVRAFRDNERPASEQLLEAVESYFQSEKTTTNSKRVIRTKLPPLYLQHAGHSLTVMGLEKRTDGTRNLLVFDPGFKPSAGILKLRGSKSIKQIRPGQPLKAYRRGNGYLRKRKEFETLRLVPLR